MSLNPQDFNCPRCSPPEQKDKGCIEDAPIPRRWQIGGETYQRCPVNLITAFTVQLIKLHRQYERGFLPVAGGILDQSALFLQAVEIIQVEIVPVEKP